MKEYTATVTEINPDFTFQAQIDLGFGQSISKLLKLRYNLELVPDKKDKALALFSTLLGKEVTLRTFNKEEGLDIVPVQLEYLNHQKQNINIIFELIALGYASVPAR